VRHPADVLVSMYHHVRRFPGGSVEVRGLRRAISASCEPWRDSEASSGTGVLEPGGRFCLPT
jgi:hypothetical protein